jgi:hypothetical protein
VLDQVPFALGNRLLTRHSSGPLRVDVATRPGFFEWMLSPCTTSFRLRLGCGLQCHPCGSPRVDALRCTTPLASPNILPATTTGDDVDPVATPPGVCESAFSGARLPVVFERAASDNFGSSSTGVRARPPLREFSTGCSQGARPPVVFECAAGLPVVFGCAAGAQFRQSPAFAIRN